MLCQRDVHPGTRITAQFQDPRDSVVSVCPTTVTAVSMAPGCILPMWWVLVSGDEALATCRQKFRTRKQKASEKVAGAPAGLKPEKEETTGQEL